MLIEENVPLAPYTTLRIGGPARYFARAASHGDISQALDFAAKKKLPVFLLGGGSNLLVPDTGYPGLVLQIATSQPDLQPVKQRDESDSVFFEVEAGTDWDTFVRAVCQQGISGVECLAGIPGTVGASPVQNIGAYGQEVSQTIHSVVVLDRITGKKACILTRQECGFSYRTSIFNSTEKDRYLILVVGFKFDRQAAPSLTYPDLKTWFADKPTPTALEVYHAVRAIRDRKAMVIHPEVDNPDTRSAGSFFKNPVVPTSTLAHIASALSIPAETIPNWPLPNQPQTKLPAAWLIEQAGFPKGYAESPDAPVAISTRHTLALVNRSGRATCADLLHLRDHIIAGVRTRFQVTLEQEPVFLQPPPAGD